MEPISGTQFSKGSFLTLESSPEVRPSLGYDAEIMRDSHFVTIVKMIETILAMSSLDTGSKKTCETAEKDVQVTILSGEPETSST